MLNWLDGKKTYFITATTFVLGGLQACGVGVPMWVYTVLAAAGLGSLRSGVKKSTKPEP